MATCMSGVGNVCYRLRRITLGLCARAHWGIYAARRMGKGITEMFNIWEANQRVFTRRSLPSTNAIQVIKFSVAYAFCVMLNIALCYTLTESSQLLGIFRSSYFIQTIMYVYVLSYWTKRNWLDMGEKKSVNSLCNMNWFVTPISELSVSFWISCIIITCLKMI